MTNSERRAKANAKLYRDVREAMKKRVENHALGLTLPIKGKRIA